MILMQKKQFFKRILVYSAVFSINFLMEEIELVVANNEMFEN